MIVILKIIYFPTRVVRTGEIPALIYITSDAWDVVEKKSLHGR